MYKIYALFYRKQNRIYVGMTSNIERRVKEHRIGKNKSTKNRGDFFPIIIDECKDRVTARKRELYWKSGCGKERLKKYRKNQLNL